MRARLIVAAAALAMLASGCGGDDGDRRGERGGGGGGRLSNDSGLELRKLAELHSPTHLAQPPGVEDLLFVTEKRGVVRVLENDRLLQRPFLDLRRYVRAPGPSRDWSRSPSRPPTGRAVASTLPTPTTPGAICGSRSSARGARIRPERAVERGERCSRSNSRRRSTTAGCCSSARTGGSTSAPVTAAPSYDPDNVGQRRKSLLGKLLRIEPAPGRQGTPIRNPRR